MEYFETVEPKKGSQVLEKSIQSAQSAQSARSARSAVCTLQSAWSAFWGDPFKTDQAISLTSNFRKKSIENKSLIV